MKQVNNPPIHLSDPLEIIIKACRDSNLAGQEQLYRHCYPSMIKICLRYAGDLDGAGIIYNNAMLRVFKHLQHYQEEGKFMGWVKTIVVNCCLDYSRQQIRFRELTQTPAGEDITINEDVFSKVSVKEIQKIIRQLPKATAIVFNLFVYEGFSHKQIGQALNISEGTSKWHVNEGRKILKTKLDNFLNS